MDWQLHAYEQMLGRHADTFDLLSFFGNLDTELVKNGDILPPQKDQHRWLEQLMFAEAEKRGLPVMGRPVTQHGWTFDCDHSPHCRTTGECVGKRKAER
jgi:hypothetical protein